MKTINIQGKDYVEVNERVKHFRENYPKYSLATKVIEKTEKSILIKATIRDEKDRVIATGIAEEIKGSSFINKNSHVENCETSAWGRALGNLGIGIDTAIASSDEVQNAILNQPKKFTWDKKAVKITVAKLLAKETTIDKIKSEVILPADIEKQLVNAVNPYPEAV